MTEIIREVSLRDLKEIAAEVGRDVEIKVSRRGASLLVFRSDSGGAVAEIVSPEGREADMAFRLYAFHGSGDADDANAWNSSRNFARVTVAEDGSLCLEHFVFIRGGVTRQFIGHQFVSFDLALAEFIGRFRRARPAVSGKLTIGVRWDMADQGEPDGPRESRHWTRALKNRLTNKALRPQNVLAQAGAMADRLWPLLETPTAKAVIAAAKSEPARVIAIDTLYSLLPNPVRRSVRRDAFGKFVRLNVFKETADEYGQIEGNSTPDIDSLPEE